MKFAFGEKVTIFASKKWSTRECVPDCSSGGLLGKADFDLSDVAVDCSSMWYGSVRSVLTC